VLHSHLIDRSPTSRFPDQGSQPHIDELHPLWTTRLKNIAALRPSTGEQPKFGGLAACHKQIEERLACAWGLWRNLRRTATHLYFLHFS